jgi:hypothetical protein
MKNLSLPFQLAFILLLSFQFSCASSKDQSKAIKNLNESPEKVMMTVFNSAKNKDFKSLKRLLPPEGKGSCDGDCKALCNPDNEAMKEKRGHNYITSAEFIKFLSNAKVIGETEIKRNAAKIQFTFGDNNQQDEVMNMQKIEGK